MISAASDAITLASAASAHAGSGSAVPCKIVVVSSSSIGRSLTRSGTCCAHPGICGAGSGRPSVMSSPEAFITKTSTASSAPRSKPSKNGASGSVSCQASACGVAATKGAASPVSASHSSDWASTAAPTLATACSNAEGADGAGIPR